MDKLTAEKAAEMLRKKGMNVSVEEAAMMLVFLRMLSDMIVTSYLEKASAKTRDAA
jgi:hypothetical protein